MTEETVLMILIWTFATIYTFIVYRFGVRSGKRKLYEHAREFQRRHRSGEDMSLGAQLKENQRKNSEFDFKI